MNMIDPTIIVRPVFAKYSKTLRAEPVAALYGQNRVYHVGSGFPELEDEMCVMGTDSVRKSPDRADALVWAVTDLLLSGPSHIGVRSL